MPTAAGEQVGDVVDPMSAALAAWRSTLIDLAGESTLADIGTLGDAILDLTAAHPSGTAQLFAGRPTKLSNLFRDGSTLPTARRRTRAVVVRATEYAQRFGLAPTYLAIGVATWIPAPPPESMDDVDALAVATGGRPDPVEPGADDPASADEKPAGAAPAPVRAPVLLRPITILPRGAGETDYELTLEPTAELNPVLARTLREHGALLDPVALARATFTPTGFDPSDALHRIASLGDAVLAGFELAPRVLAGSFVHPGHAVVDDLDDLIGNGLAGHELVQALAGLEPAMVAVRPNLSAPVRGDVDPAIERGVGDLDAAARHVVDVLAEGVHLAVDAPSGSDAAGTVAAVVAEAAASGRTVLYVAGHRRAADAVLARLDALGLDGLALDVAPEPAWRRRVSHRLLSAMAVEAERIDADAVARTRDALLGSRAQLAGYISALHLVRDGWGVSAYDALQALARLTAHRPGPDTRVRLPADIAPGLDGDRRAKLGADLTRAAELGAFTARIATTPWHGADLTSDEEARVAVARVDRLRTRTLPQLRAQVAAVADTTGLVPATTMRQWGDQVRMLGGMRETLDVFRPLIFEQTAADMVDATGTKAWRAEHDVAMGWFLRRRQVRRAKDMLRPGVRVRDLHGELVKVQAQRAIWQEQCPRGGWPVLPEGLAEIEDTLEAVRIDLDELVPILAGTAMGGDPADVDLAMLADRFEALAQSAADLRDLPERTVVLRNLRAVGLGPLLGDLEARQVPATLVAAELELSWWTSAFEQIRAMDPALAYLDGPGLEALANRFREADSRQVAWLAAPIRIAAHEHLGAAMRAHREEAEALFAELLDGRLTGVRDTFERHPDVAPRLRPVLLATPTLVPHLLPATRTVDLVVLDAVEHTPMELLLPAIGRGRQVVVLGDVRAASTPTVGTLAQRLPLVRLEAEPSRRDPFLTAFLAEHGYEGVLRPAPVPRSESLLRHEVVDGVGMPDSATGAVESTQAEVEKAVEVAIECAIVRPDESFAVVTVNPAHADRIREALLHEVRGNPALAGALSAARAEPVVVADLTGVAGLVRDAIVFSVGLGRTPHGRVLHRFGALGVPGGEAMLLDALGAARRRLHVVSSFGASDLDPERLRTPGARLLAAVLDLASRRDGAADQVVLGRGVDLHRSADRLVLDLAERLWREGLLVETNYGIGDGIRIPLAIGHPDLPGELLVAVLTDDDAYVAEPSIRVRDRQVPELLERLGWVVTRVWAAAAFLDPVKEAERLRGVVQAVRDARLPEAGGVAPTGGGDRIVVVPMIEDDDAGDDLADPAAEPAVEPVGEPAAPVGEPAAPAAPVGRAAEPVVEPDSAAEPVVEPDSAAPAGPEPVVEPDSAAPAGPEPVVEPKPAAGAAPDDGHGDGESAVVGDGDVAAGEAAADPGIVVSAPDKDSARPDDADSVSFDDLVRGASDDRRQGRRGRGSGPGTMEQ